MESEVGKWVNITAFSIASERRRVNAARPVDKFQNMQEQVEAMENALGKMNSPDTAVVSGGIQHRPRKTESETARYARCGAGAGGFA